MNNLVLYSVDRDVAVLTIDNPPVNAIGPGVPEAILDGLRRAVADPAVRAVVLIGAGRTFIAGADIREFEKVTRGEKPSGTLYPMLLEIEDCAKPVVMAIHGTALGGGLEIAQAGHYRVALASAQVGQPEVKLGLIPGAAGTQRLPRLAGVAKAVEMCWTGDPIPAAEAHAAGIVDLIVDGDLLAGAVAFAREVVGPPTPKTRERNGRLAGDHAAVFEAARAAARKRARGQTAPLVAIDAVEAATRLPFDEGCSYEAERFRECLFSDQSKALIHAFFGERTVAKIPGIAKDTPLLPVRTAAVIGAGTMGGGIAMVYSNAGIPVLLREATQEALDRGLATIRKNYESTVRKGRVATAEAERRIARIQGAVGFDGIEDADMIVEAVFENMALKQEVFAEIDGRAKPGAILATNTSTLDIDEIASATSRPESVIGTHYFSPANIMRLLEIVRGKHTGIQVIATAMDLARRLNKIGVLVGNCRGFVGNRMFHPYRREAVFLAEEGTPPSEIDAALVDWGIAMGPLAVGDLAGLDVGWRIRKEYKHLEVAGIRYPQVEDLFCERGMHGQKTRAGWYRYDENRAPLPNSDAERIVAEYVALAGIPQRRAPADEIVERCIYALVNEGARILEEGIALRAVDLDIVYIHGYGFPAWRGGPMWYAGTVGLPTILNRLREFQEKLGPHWEPAPLLERLALRNSSFAAWDASRAASVQG